MKAKYDLLMVGGFTLAIVLNGPVTLAGETVKTNPSSVEFKESTERGIYSTEIPASFGSSYSSLGAVHAPSAAKQPTKAIEAPSKTSKKFSFSDKDKKAGIGASKMPLSHTSGSKKDQGKFTTAKDETSNSHKSVQPLAVQDTGGGNFVVSARLNKSGAIPKYKIGEKMVVDITASSDCNLVVFDYDGGTLTQIFPNEYQQNGLLKAGESVNIGGVNSPFDYEIGGKGGPEKLFVYAYPISAPNPLTVAFNPLPHTPFRATPLTIEQYKDLVNNSRVFFSREVKVVPKMGVKPVSNLNSQVAPNKIELSFMVEAK